MLLVKGGSCAWEPLNALFYDARLQTSGLGILPRAVSAGWLLRGQVRRLGP
jgi:hypothetical protein